MSNKLTQKEFDLDDELKKKYGNFENYTKGIELGNTKSNSNEYTLSDAVSVANNGSLPKVEEKTENNNYMEEATNIYNKQVENIDKSTANQAAIAGTQYRELNRNVNEINKANGRANTGYAGDTSIEAYNAYRNSVNEAYGNGETAKNDLYSYYLNNMANYQQSKETQEQQQEQFEWQKEQANRDFSQQQESINAAKNENIANKIEILKGDNPYDRDGQINGDVAERLWKFANDTQEEEISSEIMSNLNSEPGFSDWLNEYNNSTSKSSNAYDLRYDILSIQDSDDWVNSYNETKDKIEKLKTEISEEKYTELLSQLKEQEPTKGNGVWKIDGLGTGIPGDSFNVNINGQDFHLDCDGIVKAQEMVSKLNKLATGNESIPPSNKGDSFVGHWGEVSDRYTPGKLVVYNGKMYVYTAKGWSYTTYNDGSKKTLDNCINAYLKSTIKK